MNDIAETAKLHRAQRLEGIDLSQIVLLSERAARLRASGRDVVSLSTGEPDLPTPEHIVAAADAAARSGQTRYPPTAGTVALRESVAASAGAVTDQVVISTGAKQVIANAMLATLDPGDEVVMPAPFWTSYADIVRMAGGVPVIVPCGMEADFKLAPEQLSAALSPRTRWLMMNAPSNPCGTVYSADEIKALAAVLDNHPQVWVLADEIYRKLSFVPFTSFITAAPSLAKRTLIVDGVSKAWSMTGWRIGWGIGPAELIAAMTKVQGQVTSGACSVAQAAALAAVTGDQQLLSQRRELYRTRRDRVVKMVSAIDGLDCAVPDGAFYVFPSCAAMLVPSGGRFVSDVALCDWLLETANVAVVPGSAFGLPGHLRLSYAYSDADLDTALSRIANVLGGTH